jgi:hypothetical protein
MEASRLCRMPHNKRMQPTSLCVTASARGASLRSAGTPRATLRPRLIRVR